MAGALVSMGTTAASAMSCAASPSDPEAVAEHGMQPPGTVAVGYDGYVFGTVVSVDRRGLLGRVDVVMKVTGSLGPPLASPTLFVWRGLARDDDRVAVGEHYFVAYRLADRGLTGDPCTVARPMSPDDVPRLIALAQASAWGDQATLGGDEAGLRFAAAPVRSALPWIVIAAAGVVALAVRRRATTPRMERP